MPKRVRSFARVKQKKKPKVTCIVHAIVSFIWK